jgi:hypothetical protein
VLLVLFEKLGVQFHLPGLDVENMLFEMTYISRRVHAVDVSEPGSNGEVRADLREAVVDIQNVLRLGVERAVLDRLLSGVSINLNSLA